MFVHIPPYLISCMKCEYYLHLHCLPDLSLTVKHKCHCHPLTFTDSPIKDRPMDKDEDDMYCSVCEEKRSLEHPSYYCGQGWVCCSCSLCFFWGMSFIHIILFNIYVIHEFVFPKHRVRTWESNLDLLLYSDLRWYNTLLITTHALLLISYSS